LDQDADSHGFLHDGEMGRRMREHDWASTPLGPIEAWPQSLRTATGILLRSPVPMVMLWGADGVMIYNDAYSVFAGRRHPQLLGSKVLEGWPEVAEFNANVMKVGLAGGTLAYKDQELVLDRNGGPEPAWMDLDYSPVPDESGRPAGVIAIVVETTERVLARRRETDERARLSQMFEQAPSFICTLRGPEHVYEFVNAAHRRLFGSGDWVGKPLREAFPDIVGQGFYELMDQVYATGERYVASGVPVRFGPSRDAAPEDRILDFIYEPMRDETGAINGIFCEGFDVTDQRRAEEDLRRSQARMAALLDLTERFSRLTDPDDLSFAAAEVLGRALGVSRAGYGVIDPARETITIARDWNAPGVTSLAGMLHFRDYGSYIDNLKRGETVMVADARLDPRTAEGAASLEAITARSFVNMPVTEEGGFVALLYLNHADARDWSDDEVELIREVAARTRAAVERRRAEAALRESEVRLQQALGAAAMGSFVWYPREDRAEGDARMMTLFGLAPDGVLSLATAIADSILPEDGARYAAAVERATDPAGDGALREDIRVRHPDGSVRWLAITGQVQFVDGQPARMAGAARDITESRLAEATLRESEARLRLLDELGRETAKSLDADEILAITTRLVGEHMGVAICAYADMDEDEDGFTIRGDWAAPGSSSIQGHYSLADFGRLSVEKLHAGQPLIIADNLAELEADAAATFQSIGITATICMPLVKDGRLTALMAIHDIAPRQWTLSELALITEVTERSWAHIERVRVEHALRELNDQLEQRVAEALAGRRILADIVDGTDAFVQVADLDYNWLAINRASADEFERLYGVRPRVGDNMLALLADRPEHRAEVEAVWARALAGESFTATAEFGDPAVDRPTYEMRFNPLRDAEGRRIGAYQFVYDVTDRLREQSRLLEAEAALHQSQKMETIGQLTGGVAHDFNNLLTPIVGALDVLRRRLDDERAQRLTAGALQAADRARTLVQRLLAFSRRQHLQPRAIDIRQLTESISDLVSRSLGPRIRFLLDVPAGLPPAHVDPNQLELAVLNLAVNARDAMEDGGDLTITARVHDHAPPGRSGTGPYICIAVTDTGSGMDAETLKRAVEPFYTTKGVGRGTGLGLSSVQGLAVQSGGAFTLHSEPGKGTTATLWLPVSTEAVEAIATGVDAEAAIRPAHAATVLLVDDEELVRAGTADMLAEAGYAVVEATSGLQALQILKSGLRPDAVITDYAMPGMTGAELAQEIAVTQAGLPVLLITGYATLSDRDAGGLPRLAKPFRQTDLAATVAELIEGGARVRQ